MDEAHIWTEKQISLLEKSFKEVYAEAQEEAQKRLDEYLEKIKKQDEEKWKELESGNISKDDYKKWRKNKMLGKQQLSSTVSEMAKAYNNADVLAMQYLNNSLPMVLGVNFDFGACEILGEKWSFKLYDQKTIGRLIAADPQLLPLPAVNKYSNLDWYQKKLNSAITQGILHGDSIPNIAKQLDSVTKSGMAAAIRNTRTAVTGAECAGRDESYRMAQADGVELVRIWKATLDNRTRHSHAAIDGETRDVDEAFSNGCMRPGDPSGDPSEVYNCRCTIVAHVKGYEKYHEQGKYGNGKLGNETYDEWKERHIAALEKEQSKNSGGDLKTKNLKDEYTQEELKQVYNSVDAMWDMTPKERYSLAEKFTNETPNQNNFFENSVGFWDLQSKRPKGDPDHISYNRRTGKVSSKYWYTEDGVYRQSDHWGSDVASCSWYISGRKYKNEGVSIGKAETAFIKWEDLKAKGLVGKNSKTGEYFITSFEFKK